mmetsp:Transcript_141344/g.249667  ORF Transcript_141344/g.249667 Transcript_141344/m.249667 type:complete len:206 (-) Transcript_141344:129-746(-)
MARVVTAAAAGNVEKVVSLLTKDGADIEERDEDGLTPLMTSARAGQLTVFKKLLEMKPEPALNAVDTEGRTAFDHAVEAGHDEVVEYMTQAPDLIPFAKGLLPAVNRADVAVVKELLTSSDERIRGDPNLRDRRGAPLLHCAIRTGNEALVETLLQHPALKVNVRDRYGRTALDSARERGHEDLAFVLRRNGAKPGDDVEDDAED